MFGPALLGNSPEMLQAFQDFNHTAWMPLFQYPKVLGAEIHNAKEVCVESFTRYFDLSKEQKPGAGEFILNSEDEMREIGIRSRDVLGLCDEQEEVSLGSGLAIRSLILEISSSASLGIAFFWTTLCDRREV
ncbi:hypothetical protein BGZ60DRAFT_532385 [Tricladium varicosporioides]|nr:hypothetical protein BGZ60DRAFT_532385 [Hymenoscyphus varicosporioides]